MNERSTISTCPTKRGEVQGVLDPPNNKHYRLKNNAKKRVGEPFVIQARTPFFFLARNHFQEITSISFTKSSILASFPKKKIYHFLHPKIVKHFIKALNYHIFCN